MLDLPHNVGFFRPYFYHGKKSYSCSTRAASSSHVAAGGIVRVSRGAFLAFDA